MNLKTLRKLKEKVYFFPDELTDLLGIRPDSARVLCSRYVKSGLFIRLKRNLYCLSETWENFGRDGLLKTSNLLQVPSYVSFMTALYIYEVTTQVQRDFFENACVRRTLKTNIGGTIFNYYKLNKKYYFGFIKKEGIFIAEKEKAFIDAAYLYSFGKYKLDINSLDLKKLDRKKLKIYLKPFPRKTKNLVRKLCRI